MGRVGLGCPGFFLFWRGCGGRAFGDESWKGRPNSPLARRRRCSITRPSSLLGLSSRPYLTAQLQHSISTPLTYNTQSKPLPLPSLYHPSQPLACPLPDSELDRSCHADARPADVLTLSLHSRSQMVHTIDLAGKNVLITGGGRGLGVDIARTFAKAGANLVLTCKSHQLASLLALASRLTHFGYCICRQRNPR